MPSWYPPSQDLLFPSYFSSYNDLLDLLEVLEKLCQTSSLHRPQVSKAKRGLCRVKSSTFVWDSWKFIPMFSRGTQMVFHMGLQTSLSCVGHLWHRLGSCSKAPQPQLSRRPDTWLRLLPLAATDTGNRWRHCALGKQHLMLGWVGFP